MNTETSLEARAAEAATAVERLARALLVTDENSVSSTTAAYLLRLATAMARVEEDAAPLTKDISPSLRHWPLDVQTTAARNP